MQLIPILILLLSGQSALSGRATTPSTPTELPPELRVTNAPYSAKCDGKTNDTESIQAAYDDARSSGGQVVFPAGTCIVSPMNSAKPIITVPSGVTTIGVGEGKSIIKVANGAGNYPTIFQVGNDNSFFGLTIDQNNQRNPIRSMNPRFAIAGLNNLEIHEVDVKNIGSVNTFVSSGRNVSISRCSFEIDESGTYYHDHSTLYLESEKITVSNNVFHGVQNAAGSSSAIETHGGQATVTGNLIIDYENGMNITGAESIDTNHVVVSGNTITGTMGGISLFAYKYPGHRSGFGLNHVLVKNNVIRITQTAWKRDAQSGRTPIGLYHGIEVAQNSNLPLRNIKIVHNSITFDAESNSSQPFSPYSTGVGYWDIHYKEDSYNHVMDFTVSDNTIMNPPASGITMVVAGTGINISGNTIIDAGQAANPGLPAVYRNGITLDAIKPSGVIIQRNEIKDDRGVSTLGCGVRVFEDATSEYKVTMLGNTFYVADPMHASFRKTCAVGTTVVPHMTATVPPHEY